MDIYVTGVKAPTEEYRKKVQAYNSLLEAGLDIPKELYEYFDYEEPDGKGIEVSIKEAVTGDVMYGDGQMIIDLSKLPEGVTHIKVIGDY